METLTENSGVGTTQKTNEPKDVLTRFTILNASIKTASAQSGFFLFDGIYGRILRPFSYAYFGHVRLVRSLVVAFKSPQSATRLHRQIDITNAVVMANPRLCPLLGSPRHALATNSTLCWLA